MKQGRPGNRRSRRRHEGVPYTLLAVTILLFTLAPALARAQALDTLSLHWTAPEDAPTSGAVARYDLRLATTPLSEANFDLALQIAGPHPQAPGEIEHAVVRGLPPGRTFWIALRSIDLAGNRSPISNVVQWTTPGEPQLDHAPPAAPLGLSGARSGDARSVALAWQAGTAPDLMGYTIYRATAPTGPWYPLNVAPLGQPAFVDDALPYGMNQLYYTVTASDFSGNESAHSASVEVVVRATRTASAGSWRLMPAYPNPARTGALTSLPVLVPEGGSSGRLDVIDDGGRIVRSFAVSGGPQAVERIVWDGGNERGEPCAPGVYRVRLTAGGNVQVIRVARVP
jgi:hypothetical protein